MAVARVQDQARIERPIVRRIGLGYRAVFLDAGIEMDLGSIRESRGEVSGLLSVSLQRPPGDPGDDRLFAARFNVSSVTARSTAAKHLGSLVQGDWAQRLEQFCIEVLAQERRGATVAIIGQRARREEGLRYLVSPVLPYRKATILFGAGGTGKSTLACGLAVSVKTGREVIPGWRPEAPLDVLVLDWEEYDDGDTWNGLVQEVAHGVGLPSPEIHYLQMTRPLADQVERVAAYVNEQLVQLVIVDSVGMAIGSSKDGENWNDGAMRLFAALRQFDATSLLIDHIAGADVKSSGPTAKMYGGVYKLWLARSVFELQAETDPGPDRTEVLLIDSKRNSRAKLPSQGFAITRRDGAIRFERTMVEAPELAQALSISTRMAQALRQGPLPYKSLAQAVGVSEDRIRVTFSRDQKGEHQRFTRLPGGDVALAAYHQ